MKHVIVILAVLCLAWSTAVAEPRHHSATVDSGRPSQCHNIPWCGCWLRIRKGIDDVSYNLASWWKHYGQRVPGPVVGAVAVMRHHVGEVVDVDANGNPVVISGNHNHRVETATYDKRRVIEYRM